MQPLRTASIVILMDDKNVYNFISFNCKSIKRSIDNIRTLCRTSDIIALQETWLLPDDIHFLNTINEDEFGCMGTSAVDTSKGMLRGRPYGGVALLWRKSVFNNVSVVQCDNPRVCAVKVTMSHKAFLVFSVYMPTDNSDNLPEFTDCLSMVSAIIDNYNIETAYILGDFNSHPGERFYNELNCFCSESNWICADIALLGLSSDTFTYVSEANGARRWLDHCIVTNSAMQTVDNVHVKYDVLWSDHYPLIMQCNLGNIRPIVYKTNKLYYNKIRWNDRKPEQIKTYTKLCNDKLKLIDFPMELCTCSDYVCNMFDHRRTIDKMYNDIIDVLSEAASASHSQERMSSRKPIVGWNRYVRDSYRDAKLKLEMWVLYGRPRMGCVWNEMLTSRKIFKSRLRWCQNHSEQIKMDALAAQHSRHDFQGFWKLTNRLNNKPGTPVSVGGVSEPEGIAELFRQHFAVESPLGASKAQCDAGCSGQKINARFVAKDVKHVIKLMSRGKSPGHDSLSIEHLRYAGCHLPRVLAMLFSLCVGHSYLPAQMTKTVVVPVVKSKAGDTSDVNNYRPISLASVISKVFDGLLNVQLDQYLKLHDNQFGFKPGLSTETAVLCLKQTVRYYTERSTPVFACFLDLSKAFDRVRYDILCQKLYEMEVPDELIRILMHWYHNQINVVRWSGALSQPYGLECGVRQGGLTSPKLFNLYINALVEELSSTRVGCHIDGVCLNNISYADDMVLLSASVCGLTKLLDICEKYADKHGLLYNVSKSECMVFQTRRSCVNDIPPIKLKGCALKRVNVFKYLGHLVTSDLRDNVDIERERRALSVRANMIARRFSRCTKAVKITLFRAFCSSFYTCSLWLDYTQKQYNALRIQYNNAFRMLLGLPRFCSASGMFAAERVDCFYTVMRKRCTSLVRRVRASANGLLRIFAERFDCQYVNHCDMIHLLTKVKIDF